MIKTLKQRLQSLAETGRRQMKNKVLVPVMIFSLFAFSGNLMATERHGADLIVYKLDGTQENGELIAVKPASLLLLDDYSGSDISVSTGDINKIKIIKDSQLMMGAGIGALLGIGAGVLTGLLFPAYSDGGNFAPYLYGILGGGAGLITGGVLGGLKGKDINIQVRGRSDRETQEILSGFRTL